MPEGLKIRVSSAELAQHLRARGKYHDERASEKSLQLPRLREAMATIAKAPAVTGVSSKSMAGYNLDPNDAVEQLEKDIRDHLSRSVSFRYLAEHLYEEDYCLDQNDLYTLEIVRR